MGLGSERHDLDELRDARRQLDRLPPAGAARGRGAARRRRRVTRATSTRARCGKRTSSGSSSRGTSIPTARSASASTSNPRIVRAKRSASTSTTAGSSRTRCPDCPRPRRRGTLAARVHAPVRVVRDSRRRVQARHEAGALVGGEGRVVGLTPTTQRVFTARAPGAVDEHRADASAPGRRARPARRGVMIDGVARRGFPTPSGQARVLLTDARRLGLARARDPHGDREPRRAVGARVQTRARFCSCRRSGFRCSSTRELETRSGSTRSRTPNPLWIPHV